MGGFCTTCATLYFDKSELAEYQDQVDSDVENVGEEEEEVKPILKREKTKDRTRRFLVEQVQPHMQENPPPELHGYNSIIVRVGNFGFQEFPPIDRSMLRGAMSPAEYSRAIRFVNWCYFSAQMEMPENYKLVDLPERLQRYGAAIRAAAAHLNSQYEKRGIAFQATGGGLARTIQHTMRDGSTRNIVDTSEPAKLAILIAFNQRPSCDTSSRASSAPPKVEVIEDGDFPTIRICGTCGTCRNADLPKCSKCGGTGEEGKSTFPLRPPLQLFGGAPGLPPLEEPHRSADSGAGIGFLGRQAPGLDPSTPGSVETHDLSNSGSWALQSLTSVVPGSTGLPSKGASVEFSSKPA